VSAKWDVVLAERLLADKERSGIEAFMRGTGRKRGGGEQGGGGGDEDDGDCKWVTIRGNPVCLTPGHGGHRKGESIAKSQAAYSDVPTGKGGRVRAVSRIWNPTAENTWRGSGAVTPKWPKGVEPGRVLDRFRFNTTSMSASGHIEEDENQRKRAVIHEVVNDTPSLLTSQERRNQPTGSYPSRAGESRTLLRELMVSLRDKGVREAILPPRVVGAGAEPWMAYQSTRGDKPYPRSWPGMSVQFGRAEPRPGVVAGPGLGDATARPVPPHRILDRLKAKPVTDAGGKITGYRVNVEEMQYLCEMAWPEDRVLADPERRRVVAAFDFDGTLAQYQGWGDGTPGDPIPGMREVIDQLQAAGAEVLIFSTRDADQIRAWLTKHEWPALEVTNKKHPRITVYIDDRALEYEPETLDTLAVRVMNFRPWWQTVDHQLADEDDDCTWITIDGRHICIQPKHAWHDRTPRVKVSRAPHWRREPIEGKRISWSQQGKMGERLAIAHLKRLGFRDARPATKISNFPVDLVHGDTLVEVKTGLASNTQKSQHWRTTIGEPGKAERRWLRELDRDKKLRWNAEKMRQIHLRKQAVVKALSRELGRPIKTETVALILDPGRRKADVYRFEGFPRRVGWRSPTAQQGYVTTYDYKLSEDLWDVPAPPLRPDVYELAEPEAEPADPETVDDEADDDADWPSWVPLGVRAEVEGALSRWSRDVEKAIAKEDSRSLAEEDDDECIWRMIGGHPVCIRASHAEHGRGERPDRGAPRETRRFRSETTPRAPKPPAKGINPEPLTTRVASPRLFSPVARAVPLGHRYGEKPSGDPEGHLNSVFRVTLENGNDAVWKPAAGEHSAFSGADPAKLKGFTQDLRAFGQPGTYWKREVAASRIARAVGMEDLVPSTDPASFGTEHGALQTFQRGVSPMTLGRDLYGKRLEDVERAVLYDAVIGNFDRHFGNWLVAPTGKLILIDHGHAFPRTQVVKHPGDLREGLRAGGEMNREIPEAVKEPWKKIESQLPTLLRGLSSATIKTTRQRLGLALKPGQTWIGLRRDLERPFM
jgi:hypothetical protein